MLPENTTVTTDIVCPECEHREWVSPEDPDASLSQMLTHIRWRHPEQDARAVLAQVHEVRRVSHP